LRTGLATGRRTGGNSYGRDGTILDLPGGPVHLEIVRLGDAPQPVAQIDYWQANGGVTYQDPDGREVVFASWIYGPPRS